MHKINDIPIGNNVVIDVIKPDWSSRNLKTAFVAHGGGWTVPGSEEDGPALEHSLKLVDHGFMIVPIRFRLAPVHKWPTMMHDVLDAINFIRYGSFSSYSNGKFGIIGASAGAHIAAMVQNVGYYSHKISLASVLLYGPYDLDRFLIEDPIIANTYVPGCFGNVSKSESPINRITSATRKLPSIELHGKEDKYVDYGQSVRYHNAKDNSKLVLIDNADHGFIGASEADKRMVDEEILFFYKTHLS